jgi:ADP-ribose pyrophosphatase YjhB (NUDIX family)
MTFTRTFVHCKRCGAPTTYLVPTGDQIERAVCSACQNIHYENPLNVVGTLPVWEDRVLLCQRNIEPRKGFWTLPAGFMELGETLAQGAVRETTEEAGANIKLQGLYSIINVVRAGQVHFFYRAQLLDLDFSPGPESMQVQLLSQQDIPWSELAFQTVSTTLKHYFSDRQQGHYELICIDI